MKLERQTKVTVGDAEPVSTTVEAAAVPAVSAEERHGSGAVIKRVAMSDSRASDERFGRFADGTVAPSRFLRQVTGHAQALTISTMREECDREAGDSVVVEVEIVMLVSRDLDVGRCVHNLRL